MHIINHIPQLESRIDLEHKRCRSIALVPTMGNLHDGHLALLDKARHLADLVVLSIFVNPIQFNSPKDYANYPKTLARDLSLAEHHGVDYVFLPAEQDIYPATQVPLSVDIPRLTNVFCGKHRPGHLQGVLKVICILFNLIRPHYAVFGEKDFQQLLVIRTMVRQLHMAVRVVGVPTVRSEAGLALSSRNVHLSDEEKESAGSIYQVLKRVGDQLVHGADNFVEMEQQAMTYLKTKALRPEYFNVVKADNLQPAEVEDKNLVILTACYLGSTRLIDNLLCKRR